MANQGAVWGLHVGPGECWALGSAMGFALGNVLTRVVSVGGDPIAGSAIRALPLVLVSVGVMAWRRWEIAYLLPTRENFLGWRAIALLAFYSLVVTPMSAVALYLAFRYGGVLVAVPVFSVHPLWGALIAVPFLGEAFNRRIGGGIAATVAGIALLTYGQHVGTPVSPQWPLGVTYALLTALGWAIGANINRYILPRGLDVFWLLGLTSGTAVVALTLLLAGLGRLGTLVEFSGTQVWQLLAAGGLSGVGSLTLFTALALTTVASATTLKSLDVGIAALIAILFLGEVLNLPVGLGILLILGGVLVVQMGKETAAPMPVTTT